MKHRWRAFTEVLLDMEPWRERAACYGYPDPDTFKPEMGHGGNIDSPWYREAVREALNVCEGCPVTTECLQYALTHDVYGVAGGKTPTEIRKLKRGGPHPQEVARERRRQKIRAMQ